MMSKILLNCGSSKGKVVVKEKEIMAVIWIILVAFVVAFILYKMIKFITADADLNLLAHSMKDEYFKGKVVWVTGASSGIGEGLCRHLSRIGAKVILSARSEDKLKSIMDGLAHPEDSRVYVLDLSDRESVSKAPVEVKSLFGRVDILINNAGVSMFCTFIDTGEYGARKLMEVDLFGTSFLTQGVLNEMMLPQGNGHIVNISSIAGKAGTPMLSFYSAAKFGLMGLMDSLRYELLDKNISITNVCPGPVKTNIDINSLTAQGEISGKRCEFIKSALTVERCVELTLIAASNNLNETWLVAQPLLLKVYLSQYMPSVASIFGEIKVDKS